MKREIGAVFSTIGIMQSVASLLSKPFFALIYRCLKRMEAKAVRRKQFLFFLTESFLVVMFRQTVEFLPGFYLLVVVGGLTLVFIPITFAHRLFLLLFCDCCCCYCFGWRTHHCLPITVAHRLFLLLVMSLFMSLLVSIFLSSLLFSLSVLLLSFQLLL